MNPLSIRRLGRLGEVFLSHTSDMTYAPLSSPEGRSYVSAAIDACLRFRAQPVDMAYFAARDRKPAEYCFERVREADVYVGIIGFRYGSLVPNRDISHTELEFQAATEIGIPRLIFLLTDDFNTSTDIGDRDRARSEHFRQRLLNDHDLIVDWFTTPDRLEAVVVHALSELEKTERQTRKASTMPTARPLSFGRASTSDSLPVPATLAKLPDVRDPLIAGHFYERLAAHALADNVFGASYAICGVWHDMQALEQVFPSARDPIRTELLRLRAWYAGRIGWLCLETGDLVNARFWADKMQDIAYELGDDNLLIYCLSLKARHAIDRQEPGQATGLAVAALESGLHAFEPDRGLGLIGSASAFASAHDQTRCARAIDEAMRVALSDSEDPNHIKTFFVPSFVAIEAAGCWLQLGQPEKTIELFEEGARTELESFKRNRGLNLSRLANAYAQIGDHEQANLVGLDSIEIALRTHSASTIRELMRLQARLRSQVRPSTLEEFDQAMRNLLTVAGRPQTLG